MLGKPVGEALVQLSPLCLRKPLVGGVAHEQMPEAKGVFPGEQRPVGADELLADERGQLARETRTVGRQRLDDAVVEHLAFDRATLEHGSLRLLELVEAGCEQCLQRGWHFDLAVVGGLHHCCHLLDEERVAARGAQDPFAHARAERSSADACLDQHLRLAGSERLQPEDAAPAATPVEQLGPGHANEQDGSARGEEGDVLEEIQEGVLAPLDVVEDGDHRRFGCDRLEQLAKRPGDLVG